MVSGAFLFVAPSACGPAKLPQEQTIFLHEGWHNFVRNPVDLKNYEDFHQML